MSANSRRTDRAYAPAHYRYGPPAAKAASAGPSTFNPQIFGATRPFHRPVEPLEPRTLLSAGPKPDLWDAFIPDPQFATLLPTAILLSGNAVAENQPAGTAVGTLSSTDPDPGDTFTYSLVSGDGDADNALFQIVGDELRTAASFDYETQSACSIRIRTTDLAGEWYEDVFTIHVGDVAEQPPLITGMSDDTGVSASDRVTSDGTLILSGTAPDGIEVELYRNGVSVGSASIQADTRQWTVDTTGTDLPDGVYVFSAVARDSFGGQSPASAPFVVVVDKAAPQQPAAPVLSPGSDDGQSTTDGITSIPNPTVTLGTLQSFFAWDTYLGQPGWDLNFAERSGTTGQLIRQIAIPWQQVTATYSGTTPILQAMADDDQVLYLLFTDPQRANGRIACMQRSDGQVLRIMTVEGNSLGGMAFLNGLLYVASGTLLLKVDPSTGAVLQTIPTSLQLAVNAPSELSAIPERGTLLWVDWMHAVEIDPHTGSVVRQTEITLADPTYLVGTPSAAYVGYDRVLCYTYEVGLPSNEAYGRALIDLTTGLPLWWNHDSGLEWTSVSSGDGNVAGPFFRLFVDGVQVGGDYLSARELQLPTLSEGQHSVVIHSIDPAGNVSAASVPLTITIDALPDATITARHLFYNRSSFDNNDPAATTADDTAIATDKQALLPGQSATFANYSSYSRGLNGIMLDLAGLSGTLTAADFTFRVGNNSTPSAWAAAPAPVSITQRALAGGLTRVTLIWADNAIQKQWLQVTLFANANTDLASNDIFYFGNAVGESGNSPSDAQVTTADEAITRNNQSGFSNVPITSLYDYNRDGRVNSQDQAITRANKSGLSPLLLITAPAGTSLRQSTTTSILLLSSSAPADPQPLSAFSHSLLYPDEPLLA